MSTTAIHTIRPLAETGAARNWRIASAVVPVAIAELTVTREEDRELSPARVLLLETVGLFEHESGRASVLDIADLSGIGDEALMASILVPLAEQGLVLIEGENVRQNPALRIDGNQARIVVEREERVCVIGSPPMPARAINRERLRRLAAFDADGTPAEVSNADLDSWRTAYWDDRTQRLQLREPLQPRMYVLEGCVGEENVFELRDEKHSVRVELPTEHPFLRQLRADARQIIDLCPDLLKPFGSWDAGESELLCSGEQWMRWRKAHGSDISEVILRGDIDVAVTVRCRPADVEAARAMLLENILAELDTGNGQCRVEEVRQIADRQMQNQLLRGHDLSTPTLAEVESGAWVSGRWELAYRIAAPADGL